MILGDRFVHSARPRKNHACVNQVAGFDFKARKEVEGHRKRQQQNPAATGGPTPRRLAGQRALHAKRANRRQQQQRGRILQFVAEAYRIVQTQGQRARPEQQRHRPQKPAQIGARFRRPPPPRQRRRQRQPDHRNIGQHAKGMINLPIALRLNHPHNLIHEGKTPAPARRVQKSNPEVEPKKAQSELLMHGRWQLVALPEFQRIVEPQRVVNHQPRPYRRHRTDRRQQ